MKQYYRNASPSKLLRSVLVLWMGINFHRHASAVEQACAAFRQNLKTDVDEASFQRQLL